MSARVGDAGGRYHGNPLLTQTFQNGPARAHSTACCLCGKKNATHPGLRLHLFPRDARRYVVARFGDEISEKVAHTVK